MDTESLRLSYKPITIRFLFVGESPPASGRFFYDKSGMTTNTARVFERVFDISFKDTPEFLDFFKVKGCYLDDISIIPVDNLTRLERNKVLIESLEDFSPRLTGYQPEVVVAILKSIETHVRRAMLMAKLTCPLYVPPFPGQGHQKKFRDEMSEILKKHMVE